MKLYSPRAQRVIDTLCRKEAERFGSDRIRPEHVLLAIVKSAEGLGYELFKELGIDIGTFRLSLEQNCIAAAASAVVHLPAADIPLDRRMGALTAVAEIEACILGNPYVGTEHFVLSALREEGGLIANYFEKAGVDIESVRDTVKKVQSEKQSSAADRGGRITSDAQMNRLFNGAPKEDGEHADASEPRQAQKVRDKGGRQSFLSEFSRDVTKIVREGDADPVVGRESEIKRLIQILSRRTKNNPVLVGEPGIGKTAIVEGLAHKIVQGDVPFGLMKKRILSLDLAALIAGTKYRGEFEERMKRLMDEVQEDRSIILFIDELHTIIGAGGPEGSMDASNMLKPALSRGEIQIIGASTTKEYARYIEKDSALVRRFQLVRVEEPTDEESEEILRGIQKQYEDFHGVSYDEGVIPAIVKLSRRYISERFLPDKAIDILDEAGAQKKIQDEQKPPELIGLELQIQQLSEEKRQLVVRQEYERAAQVRDRTKELKQQLEEFTIRWKTGAVRRHLRVTVADICRLLSESTGIPVDQLDASETARLVSMEAEMHRNVVGQEDAVRRIAGAIRRSRAGISSPKRPIGSFVFLGPTGVGKTQLAKALAAFLFGSEEQLVRIDMSDFMEKHNASRLVGAPPGYVGYEDGGLLTEQVRRHPYSVVLLDEIEKAHPDVFNLLLQLLEEGELSDNLGHTVSFRNTVVIMTSNAGARQITNEGRAGFSPAGGLLSQEEIRSGAMTELKKLLSPELMNRIDDIIVFRSLTEEDIREVARRML
ncbi:MAG: ATP-dependent Clp protease ATP-binding subunit, partial [Treponemataceae bacterium]|nr:ATP-dependent Clp protease ATP-binding subunit [Treponemataceae bacterium]